MSRLLAAGLGLFLILLTPFQTFAQDGEPSPEWQATLQEAKGQTVYFHAWGGEPRINAFIAWAGREVERDFGVRVVHVKVSDTASVVSQVLTEKSVGKTSGGAVDLIWINGENFASMKENDLLAAPGWAQTLPNWRYVDVENKPTVVIDFTVPTEGRESPWGMAKLVFMHDSARLQTPPATLEELLAFAKDNPGRFAYPQPPNFHGTTFLKQVLVETIADRDLLSKPVSEADFDGATAPLFAYLDALNPVLWRQGKAFPKDAAHLRRLLADGELDIAFSFNPGDAAAAIANGELPPSVRSFVLDGGTIGNTHFVAIPFNSSSQEGAKVFADFLLSPMAQARKRDPEIWGDPTVLNVAGLPANEKALFETQDLGPAALSPQDLGPVLPEPHPSWVSALENAWTARYGAR
ncbi:ABC transporter substrate-binding protein [Roseibium marinum]|uniref:Putative thiamine transport system substrate-binding protein n=1 Tax=Roseibium marinum TaxID=281252 RepID=A0A2S3V340_9HYPH|nr:ABC transporter substrate-binding protein [Roseibium marinum]POF34407.1 putative thiamine transport system substrate-binding protein [Roseibium marinum]